MDAAGCTEASKKKAVIIYTSGNVLRLIVCPSFRSDSNQSWRKIRVSRQEPPRFTPPRLDRSFMSKFFLKIASYLCFCLAIFCIIPLQVSVDGSDVFYINRTGLISILFFSIHRFLEIRENISKINLVFLFLYAASFSLFVFLYDLSLQKILN